MGVVWMFSILASMDQAMAQLQIEPVVTGLAAPTSITHAGDGSGRLFVTLRRGQIVILTGGQVLAKPFLDISQLVSCCEGERGLLSLAFHPSYAANRYFFVNYTDLNGDTVVARYRASAADPNSANPHSAVIVLNVKQPFANHNGGQLQFGLDGLLYIGMGDGGSSGDPGNRAQNLGVLLGKMLRIRVSVTVSASPPYTVPADNPFVGTIGARPEIWALGLRNPWRFSFDRQTGQLFIGDVGQENWEEIDLQKANSRGGENYGWRLMEGRHCFNPASGCNDGSLLLPVLEYNHRDTTPNPNCSITGGYRYRGVQIPTLAGRYLFADFCSGRIWGARFVPGTGWRKTLLRTFAGRINTFGEDEQGEIYFADYSSGSIFRITGFVP